MKKYASSSPFLAVVVSVTGCVPMEPVAENPEGEICRMESAIGTHLKEVDCKHNPDEQRGNVARTDRDIGGVFGDVVLDGSNDLPNFPEGSCGAAPFSD
jgi:hypothetical protein